MTAARVLTGRYLDSVVLMRLAQRLVTLDGIEDAAAMMATDANKAVLAEGGFSAPEIDAAGPDDTAVAVKAASGEAAANALAQVDELLARREQPQESVPHTLADAIALEPGLNLAAISLPAEYAAAEARGALERGLHVFLFTSNVSLEDELELKALATERGLLCMGPDCGTAMVAGTGLGFANAVRRGRVGIVGASGTGIQAVSSLLDLAGEGVSHAIGCGSRDLSAEVKGATAHAALDALLEDASTEAIVVLSKPPAAEVAAQLRRRASEAAKPVVCCFLGEHTGPQTFDEVVAMTLEALGAEPPDFAHELPEELGDRLDPGRRFIRGLYAGGTLAYETQLVLARAGLDVASNAPLPGADRIDGNGPLTGHVVLDLGAEEFTRGRPHPMIDSRVRRAQLRAQAADSDVAAILLDFVLGYGAAEDPAGDLADEIQAAYNGAGPLVLASVTGTERDPQVRSRQEKTLRDAGAHVFPSNAAAAAGAAQLAARAPLVGSAR